jgi:hypothetical protein
MLTTATRIAATSTTQPFTFTSLLITGNLIDPADTRATLILMPTVLVVAPESKFGNDFTIIIIFLSPLIKVHATESQFII